MLYLRKYNYDLLQKELQEQITNNHVRIFGESQHLFHFCIYESHIQYKRSASRFIFGVMFYAKKSIAKMYVSIYFPLIKLIYLCWERININNSIKYNYDNNNNYIHKYDQE